MIHPSISKQAEKIKREMVAIRRINGRGKCWVCNSTSGVKAGRNSYTNICRACELKNKSTSSARKYNELKRKYNELKRIEV